MPSESTNLFNLARNKLHLSLGSRSDCSLHRWVLLKNSIVHSTPHSSSAPDVAASDAAADVRNAPDTDYTVEEEVDSFMFPDADQLIDDRAAEGNGSEEQWLDSLLETLSHEEEDDFGMDSDVHSMLAEDDDDDSLLSPSISPMSSSDDLTRPPVYYPPPIAVPYPVPYPPYQPPPARADALPSPFDIHRMSPYLDPLPYHDAEDEDEDLSMPDAIEDTSDDESDSPLTPSIGHSGSLSQDPAQVPLPGERSGLREHVHILVDTDDSYFYPFAVDPLPFPDDQLQNPYNTYQEC
ncbi:hypothetical protein BD626DRAFT_72749 [Schizophyllum amplum]|uniref:Uncharacterized protein n=1 Tax=Schizophyllum amplum TaxID=97359 RepID=A0A550CAH0_9AGAR|nr:hypothetical protein BD626DRAFT_72749 [Auriculariopsis ampla]